MLKRFFTAVILGGFLIALAGCDVDQVEEGELPDIDVEATADPGKLPEYDVETPEVDVTTEEKTVEVPELDVDTETSTVEVPEVDVSIPDEEGS